MISFYILWLMGIISFVKLTQWTIYEFKNPIDIDDYEKPIAKSKDRYRS